MLQQALEHKNLGLDLGLHLDHLELDHDYDQLHHQRLNQQAFEPEGLLLAQELLLLVDMLLDLYIRDMDLDEMLVVLLFDLLMWENPQVLVMLLPLLLGLALGLDQKLEPGNLRLPL